MKAKQKQKPEPDKAAAADEQNTEPQEVPAKHAQDDQIKLEKELKKLRKRQKKERKRELKHILLGSYRTLEDGRMVSGGEALIPRQGFMDGAVSILLLGITDKRYKYLSDKNNPTQAKYAALNAMKNIGRELVLSYAPDAKACYVRGIFFRSVILVFDEEPEADGSRQLELHAYCGRSLMTFFSVRRAVSKFDRQLPDNVHRV